MKAIICKNVKKPDDGSVSAVREKLISLEIEAEFSDKIHADCDLVITVGGDGTILHYGKAAARLNKPLLGINTGRLGFMTSLEINELEKLELLCEKKWEISSRMMLDIELGEQVFLALNDAVFLKAMDSKMPEFNVRTSNTIVSEIRADGLILSTPTGSTAYALSAGGPIIEPSLHCIEITPLCAHSLFGRPMILSAENPLFVQYCGKADTHSVYVSVDGEKALRFEIGDVAVIRKSALHLDLINLDDKNFHTAVSNKLMKPFK